MMSSEIKKRASEEYFSHRMYQDEFQIGILPETVWDNVIDHLTGDPSTLLRLRKVCKTLKRAIDAQIQHHAYKGASNFQRYFKREKEIKQFVDERWDGDGNPFLGHRLYLHHSNSKDDFWECAIEMGKELRDYIWHLRLNFEAEDEENNYVDYFEANLWQILKFMKGLPYLKSLMVEAYHVTVRQMVEVNTMIESCLKRRTFPRFPNLKYFGADASVDPCLIEKFLLSNGIFKLTLSEDMLLNRKSKKLNLPNLNILELKLNKAADLVQFRRVKCPVKKLLLIPRCVGAECVELVSLLDKLDPFSQTLEMININFKVKITSKFPSPKFPRLSKLELTRFYGDSFSEFPVLGALTHLLISSIDVGEANPMREELKKTDAIIWKRVPTLEYIEHKGIIIEEDHSRLLMYSTVRKGGTVNIIKRREIIGHSDSE